MFAVDNGLKKISRTETLCNLRKFGNFIEKAKDNFLSSLEVGSI